MAHHPFFTVTEHIVPKFYSSMLAQGLERCISKAGYRRAVIFRRVRAEGSEEEEEDVRRRRRGSLHHCEGFEFRK